MTFSHTIYCVGRNYVDHAKELNNPISQEPVIFTKTASSVTKFHENTSIPLSLGRCDHELEIAVQINQDLYQQPMSVCQTTVSHLALALDLTRREKQSELKSQKLPWTLAKSFPNACILGDFHDAANVHLDDISFTLKINGEIRQHGNTKDMIFDIHQLIHFIQLNIPIKSGDIILTGTPEGVGPLHDGDKLEAFFGPGKHKETCTVHRK
ncbi:fumarylacetoacetate hydrolase family protein [Algicola sagamiensis]|uniref:fumarylacetoacetate hydrolase family protein n=1 Tax=Algicola sagamiensis TaxID=163869 RepID=UPI00146CE5C4|nr:fumarylacetoacetate hydrolase family protein [Algicola sagamiensis]